MKAIIFDLGGVYFTDGSENFANYVHKKYGNSKSKVLNAIRSSEPATNYRIGKISKEEYWKKVLEILKINENPKVLQKIYLDGYKPIEGTIEIIRKLKVRYKLAYLSDNVKDRAEYLQAKFDFKKDFDCGVLSHDVGVRKPDPMIYKLVLEKLGIKPEESIFIDDLEISLEGARKVGLKTVLFKNPQQLINSLKKIGVKLD